MNTFYTCEYGFYLTYALKNDRDDNIYSFAGTRIHDILDRIYNSKLEYDLDIIEEEFKDFMMECYLEGYKFPTEKTEANWMADMTHFVSNYQKMHSVPLASEERILFNLDGIWLQGYVDYQEKNEDGSINIIDWKTSTKFTGKKLKEAGRQLVLYKLAKESEGETVDKIGWYMIKYLNITYSLKNGKQKTSMYERSKWVEKLSKTLKSYLDDYTYQKASEDIISNNLEEINSIAENDIKIQNRLDKGDYGDVVKELLDRYDNDSRYSNLLTEYGHSPLYNDLLVEESIINNNIDNLPKEFQKLFTVEDCVVWYDYTEQDIQDLKDYIKETVRLIEERDKKDIFDWTPTGVMENKFYCEYLCGQRKNCQYSLTEEEKRNKDELPF